MAKVPTPEESGRSILNIFADFGIGPGEVLPRNSIESRFLGDGGRARDTEAGLNLLLEEGSIKPGRQPNTYELTEEGFAKM